MIAADVSSRATGRWTPEVARRRSSATRDRRRSLAPHRRDRDRDDGAAADGRARPVARMVELRGVEPGFPFYGTLALQTARRIRTTCCAITARWCGRSCWRSSGSRSATADLIGGAAVHDSRRHRAGAGPQRRRVQPRLARARRLRRPARRPGCCRSAAAPATRCCCKVRDGGGRAADARRSARDFRDRVRQRALVPVDRGSDRREPAARRELPEPGRLRDGRARRHRRVERHARVRAAEDPQRRDPQVHRRVDRGRCWRPTCCRCCCSALAGSAARRRARRRSRIAAIPASLGGGVRRRRRYGLTRVGGRPGPRRRAAGVAAVLAGAAARSAARQAAAAARGRIDRAAGCRGMPGLVDPAGATRLAASTGCRSARRRWSAPRSSPSRLAGGLAARRADASAAGSPRVGARAAPRRRRRSSAPCSRCAARRWFPLRHAVLSLGRPGNQTRVILLAVGLGSFFILGVRALQANLLAVRAAGRRGGADMFLIDIQPAQVDGVARLHRRQNGADAAAPQLIPVLRARVTGVRGREINLELFERRCARRGSLAREYTITYRDRPRAERDARSTGASGAVPAARRAGARSAEVSIEKSIHERFAHRRRRRDALRRRSAGRSTRG